MTNKQRDLLTNSLWDNFNDVNGSPLAQGYDYNKFRTIVDIVDDVIQEYPNVSFEEAFGIMFKESMGGKFDYNNPLQVRVPAIMDVLGYDKEQATEVYNGLIDAEEGTRTREALDLGVHYFSKLKDTYGTTQFSDGTNNHQMFSNDELYAAYSAGPGSVVNNRELNDEGVSISDSFDRDATPFDYRVGDYIDHVSLYRDQTKTLKDGLFTVEAKDTTPQLSVNFNFDSPFNTDIDVQMPTTNAIDTTDYTGFRVNRDINNEIAQVNMPQGIPSVEPVVATETNDTLETTGNVAGISVEAQPSKVTTDPLEISTDPVSSFEPKQELAADPIKTALNLPKLEDIEPMSAIPTDITQSARPTTTDVIDVDPESKTGVEMILNYVSGIDPKTLGDLSQKELMNHLQMASILGSTSGNKATTKQLAAAVLEGMLFGADIFKANNDLDAATNAAWQAGGNLATNILVSIFGGMVAEGIAKVPYVTRGASWVAKSLKMTPTAQKLFGSALKGGIQGLVYTASLEAFPTMREQITLKDYVQNFVGFSAGDFFRSLVNIKLPVKNVFVKELFAFTADSFGGALAELPISMSFDEFKMETLSKQALIIGVGDMVVTAINYRLGARSIKTAELVADYNKKVDAMQADWTNEVKVQEALDAVEALGAAVLPEGADPKVFAKDLKKAIDEHIAKDNGELKTTVDQIKATGDPDIENARPVYLGEDKGFVNVALPARELMIFDETSHLLRLNNDQITPLMRKQYTKLLGVDNFDQALEIGFDMHTLITDITKQAGTDVKIELELDLTSKPTDLGLKATLEEGKVKPTDVTPVRRKITLEDIKSIDTKLYNRANDIISKWKETRGSKQEPLFIRNAVDDIKSETVDTIDTQAKDIKQTKEFQDDLNKTLETVDPKQAEGIRADILGKADDTGKLPANDVPVKTKAEAGKAFNQLNQTIGDITDNIKTQKTRLLELTNRLDDLTGEPEVVVKKLGDLTDSLNKTTDDIRSLQQQINTLDIEPEVLSGKIVDINSRLKSITDQLDELKSTPDVINKEVAEYKTYFSDLINKTDSLKGDQGKLRIELEDLKTKLYTLTGDANGIDKAFGDLYARIDLLSESPVYLRGALRDVEMQVGDLNTKSGKLNTDIDTIGSKVNAMQLEFDKLQTTLVDLRAHGETLKAEQQRITNELEIQKQELAVSKTEEQNFRRNNVTDTEVPQGIGTKPTGSTTDIAAKTARIEQILKQNKALPEELRTKLETLVDKWKTQDVDVTAEEAQALKEMKPAEGDPLNLTKVDTDAETMKMMYDLSLKAEDILKHRTLSDIEFKADTALNKKAVALADEFALTAKQARELGSIMKSAPEIVTKLRKIITATGEELSKRAKAIQTMKAVGGTPTRLELAQFEYLSQLMASYTYDLKNIWRSTGQTLTAGNIQVDGTKVGLTELSLEDVAASVDAQAKIEAILNGGGSEKAIMKRILKTAEATNIGEVNTIAKSNPWSSRALNAIVDYRTSNLLTNPNTHLRNIVSQTANMINEGFVELFGATINNTRRLWGNFNPNDMTFTELGKRVIGNFEGLIETITKPLATTKDVYQIVHGTQAPSTFELMAKSITDPKEFEKMTRLTRTDTRAHVENFKPGLSSEQLRGNNTAKLGTLGNIFWKTVDYYGAMQRNLSYGLLEAFDRPFAQAGYYAEVASVLQKYKLENNLSTKEIKALKDDIIKYRKNQQYEPLFMKRAVEVEGKSPLEAVKRVGELSRQYGVELDVDPRRLELIKKFDDMAMTHAKDMTWKTPLDSKMGTDFEKFVNANPALRVVFPFVHTPTKIIEKWAYSSGLSGKFWKDVLGKNGTEMQTKAMARLAVSMTLYGIGAYLYINRELTPTARNASERQRMLNAGIQENSIRIGNSWVSINVIDPAPGMYLSTVANVCRAFEEATTLDERDDIYNLFGETLFAMSRNVLSKTYTKTLKDTLNALSGMGTDYYVKSLQDSFKPLRGIRNYYNASTKDYLEEVNEKSLIGKPKLDVLGKPIVNYSYIIGLSKHEQTESPIRLESLRLGLNLSDFGKFLNGVKLDPLEQYTMKQYMGTIDAESRLNNFVTSAGYLSLAPDQQKDAITDYWRNLKKQAQSQVIKTESYQERYRQIQLDKYEQIKTGTTEEHIINFSQRGSEVGGLLKDLISWPK